jgi:hypothetical protein
MFIRTLSAAAVILALLSLASESNGQNIAGEWTQCVALHNGEQWNIVNGKDRNICFKLARRCTGNPNVQATFYSAAVIINAPYRRCDRICIGADC